MNIETENRYIEDLKAEMEGCTHPRQVVDELREKTLSHDSKACLDLGYILCYGIGGIREDKRSGVRSFLQAFHYGNKDGLDALENMAERGEPEALLLLGRMYYRGEDCERDIRKAVEYFEKGAKLGNTRCMSEIAKCYLKGDGVEKDVSKAIEYCKKAVEYGSRSAIFQEHELWFAMSQFLYPYNEEKGVEEDDRKVFEFCKENYELHPNSVQWLAYCYDEGIGTQKDEKKAFELIKESAEKGNRHDYYDLAIRYEEGEGTEVDIKEAYKWYLKNYEASNHWSLKSLKKMISILEENPGIEKDEDKLKEYKEELKGFEPIRNRK